MAMKRGSRVVPAKRTRALPGRITQRRKVSGREFVFPEDRRYPIPDAYHATLALSSLLRTAGRHGVTSRSREDARKVLEVVCDRFPSVCEGESDLVEQVRRTYFGRRGSGGESSVLDAIYRRHHVR